MIGLRIAATLLATAILGGSAPARPPRTAAAVPVARGVMALPATKVMVLGVWPLDGADPAPPKTRRRDRL